MSAPLKKLKRRFTSSDELKKYNIFNVSENWQDHKLPDGPHHTQNPVLRITPKNHPRATSPLTASGSSLKWLINTSGPSAAIGVSV